MCDRTTILPTTEVPLFRNFTTSIVGHYSESAVSLSGDIYWTEAASEIHNSYSPESTMVNFDALLSPYSLEVTHPAPNRQFSSNCSQPFYHSGPTQSQFQGHEQFPSPISEQRYGDNMIVTERNNISEPLDDNSNGAQFAPTTFATHMSQALFCGSPSSGSAAASISASASNSETLSGSGTTSGSVSAHREYYMPNGAGSTELPPDMEPVTLVSAPVMQDNINGVESPVTNEGKYLPVCKGDPRSRSEIRRARAARNRSSARRSRLKKKAESERDRERALQIQVKNDALKNEVQHLRQKLTSLQRVVNALGLSGGSSHEAQKWLSSKELQIQ